MKYAMRSVMEVGNDPNDVRRVIWTLSEFFLFSLYFKIPTNVNLGSNHYRRWDGTTSTTSRRPPPPPLHHRHHYHFTTTSTSSTCQHVTTTTTTLFKPLPCTTSTTNARDDGLRMATTKMSPNDAKRVVWAPPSPQHHQGWTQHHHNSTRDGHNTTTTPGHVLTCPVPPGWGREGMGPRAKNDSLPSFLPRFF